MIDTAAHETTAAIDRTSERPVIRPTTLGIAVAAIAVAVYLNSLLNGFALDDVMIVQWNTRVHDLTNLRDIWLTPYWPASGSELGLYRPAAIFLYAVQWSLGGGEPWLFHGVNVLLHATASVLVFALARTLAGNTAAFVGAVIFAVHPVHTEAIANVVGQAELVAAVIVLTACIIHARRPEPPELSRGRTIGLVILFLFALLTKESAVVLPALLVLVDVARGHVRPDRRIIPYARAMAIPLLLMCAAFITYMIVRFDVMGGALIGTDANPAIPYLKEDLRVLNALRAFPEFMRLLFYPAELAADYLPAVIMPVEEVGPMVVLGGLLLAGLTAMAIATPWSPQIGLPAAWFLITILTVSNLFFPVGVLVAERTLYLPSVALSLAVAIAWSAGMKRAPRTKQRIAMGAVIAAVLLMGIRTWIRNPDWKDNQSVYDALVRDHPHAYRAQWVQAAALRLHGNTDLALQHYAMANRIYAGDAQMLEEYASLLLETQNIDNAIEVLDAARVLQPRAPRTTAMLAQAHLLARQPDQALDYVRLTEQLGRPQFTFAIRALAHYSLGQHDRAVGAARVALERTETPWQTTLHLARILAVGGFPDEAVDVVARVRANGPSNMPIALLDAFESAIRSGCYAETVETDVSPACDPLPGGDADSAAQNATVLQNAIDPTVRNGSGEAGTTP